MYILSYCQNSASLLCVSEMVNQSFKVKKSQGNTKLMNTIEMRCSAVCLRRHGLPEHYRVSQFNDRIIKKTFNHYQSYVIVITTLRY